MTDTAVSAAEPRNGFARVLRKRIETEHILNEKNLSVFAFSFCSLIIVFNLILGHLMLIGRPAYDHSFIPVAVEQTRQGTTDVMVFYGDFFNRMVGFFSMEQGPLLNTFEVVEYYGQHLGRSVTSAISAVQRSLDFSTGISFAAAE